MIDPVCGMEVTPEDAAGSYQYQGQQYYFCNESCLEQFQANPEAFSPLLSTASRRKVPIPTPFTPARWIRRSASAAPARVPSAAWRSNPLPSLRKRKPTRNSASWRGDSGSAWR